MEIQHKSFWEIKAINLDCLSAASKRLLDLNELKEFRLLSYENVEIYKVRSKAWHDNRIIKKKFSVGMKVLLFNSKFKIFTGKLKSK